MRTGHFVVRKVKHNLLGLPAIHAPHVLMQVNTVSRVSMSQSPWLENVCYEHTCYDNVAPHTVYFSDTCHRTSSPYEHCISSGCVFPLCPAGIIFGNLCCRCHWKLLSMQTTTYQKIAHFGCLCIVFQAEIYTLTIIVWWRSAYTATCSQVTAYVTN